MHKLVYASQPYRVGSKNAKSWAHIIPAPVAKEYKLSESSVLLLRRSEKQDTMILQFIDGVENKVVSASRDSLPTSCQQVPVAL